jgi:hypothetical protein
MTHAAAARDSARTRFVPASKEERAAVATAARRPEAPSSPALRVSPTHSLGARVVPDAAAACPRSTPTPAPSSPELALVPCPSPARPLCLLPLPSLPSLPPPPLPLLHGQYESAAVVSTASVQLEKVRTPQKKLNQHASEQNSAHHAASCDPANQGPA